MPVTFNPNNNYDVEIVNVPNINFPYLNGIQSLPVSGQDFVELKITPTNFGYPLIAGNMRVGGASYSSSGTGMPFVEWSPKNNPNPRVPGEQCLPCKTPHDLATTNPPQHVYAASQWVAGSACQNWGFYGGNIGNRLSSPDGFEVLNNESFQGPYRWYNSSMTIGQNQLTTGAWWEEMVIIEVYEDDSGNLINDNISPLNYNTDVSLGPVTHNWIWWDYVNGPSITNNIYPKYLKAFVFIAWNSNIFLGPNQPGVDIFVDLDEAAPVSGCMDPTALNYDPLAVIDDGTCSYFTQQSSQVTLNFSIASIGGNFAPVPAGPYTDGSTYTTPNPFGPTFSITTVDFANTFPSSDSNITLLNGALTQDVVLSNYYFPGDHVNELVEIYVYPLTNQGGPVIYDFPGVGGPNAGFNLPDPTNPDYDDYVQRMYPGWGNAKNNLTAASLTVLVGSGGPTNFWLDPEYQDPSNFTGAIQYSLWHNGPDPSGLQPTQRVDYNYGGSVPPVISGISGIEEYNPLSANPARDWFPTKVKISIQLDFYMPSQNQTPGPGSGGYNTAGTMFDIPILIKHDTSRQGDLNWTI
tara:strand:+ start:527 stop:2260 length:1734 start_codon:yes stop_codon:yes gene_type:complete